MFPKPIKQMDAKARRYGLGFLNRTMTLTLDMEKCQACGICVDACPKNALELTQVKSTVKAGIKAYIPDISDPNKCSYCGVCQVMCPFDALTLKDGAEAIKTEELDIIIKRAMPKLQSELVESKKLKRKIKSYFEGTIALKDNAEWSGFKICADVCPTDALKFDEQTNKLELDKSKCIYCGSCKTVAPKKDLIELKRTAIKFSGPYNKELWEPLKSRLFK